jgi:hypothetical protein
VDAKRINEAMHELAMNFFTSNTPPERVENVHLKKSFALLGSQTPSARDLRTGYLAAAHKHVEETSVNSLLNSRYAIVTDGRSKRTGQRGAPLININICPDDGPAMFWKVVDTSG